jgi:hypothetical protein
MTASRSGTLPSLPCHDGFVGHAGTRTVIVDETEKVVTATYQRMPVVGATAESRAATG